MLSQPLIILAKNREASWTSLALVGSMLLTVTIIFSELNKSPGNFFHLIKPESTNIIGITD